MRKRPVWIAAAALLLLAGAWLGYRAWRQARAWDHALTLSVADFAPGSVHRVQDLWVARLSSGEFYVYEPHSDILPDRAIEWDATLQAFVEPISSARYTIDGRGVFGPAGNLYRLRSKPGQGDTLLVLKDQVISGGPDTPPMWLLALRDWVRHVMRLSPVRPQAPVAVPAAPAPSPTTP